MGYGIGDKSNNVEKQIINSGKNVIENPYWN